MTARLRSWLGWSVLVVWAPLTLLVTAALMVNHVVAMPEPSDLDRLLGAASGLRSEHHAETLVVHVVAEGCSCTDSLFAHLLERGPRQGLDEVVLYVGDDPARQEAVRQRGYRLVATDRVGLQHTFGLEAAPILMVLDPTDSLLYLGGYYRYPAAVRPLDEHILGELGSGEVVDGLPIFGCAVSERLAEQLDPLGLTALSP